MSSGKNVYESLSNAWSSISNMVIGDESNRKRDPKQVLRLLQHIIENPDFISVLDAPRNQTHDLLPLYGWQAEWQHFYAEVFDLHVDFTGVVMPPEQPGFAWVVMVAQSLTLNQVWSRCKECFPAHSYLGDDLDWAVTTNDRTPTAVYAKRFRNRMEADEENENLSADSLAKRDSGNITLLERILLELWYHWRTGEHLDQENITLCAGSRNSRGDVPSAGWCGGEFKVDCCYPGRAYHDLRSRSAV